MTLSRSQTWSQTRFPTSSSWSATSWRLSGYQIPCYTRQRPRPVADRFELSRHVEIARTWSQTGSQLAFDQLSTSLRHAHDTRTQVCDLDSVMECGFKQATDQSWIANARTSQLADWTSHELHRSRTSQGADYSQLADWSIRGCR